MFRKLIRHNISWLLSMLVHLLLLLLIIVFSINLNKANNQRKISVSIISLPAQIQLKNDRQKWVSRHKVNKIQSDNGKKPKEQQVIKKEDDMVKELAENEKIIKDISYSKNTYQIGSEQNPLPPYPRIARLKKYQGKVEISVVIDSEGQVVNAQIHRSSSYSILDNASLETIKKWRFNVESLLTESADKNQYYRIIVPISFILE